MAGRRQGKTIDIAKAIFGRYVKEVRVAKDPLGRSVMGLIYNNGHTVTILETNPSERLRKGKWPWQSYHMLIVDPEGKNISDKKFLTAKLIKMAILKTKALDMLKGAKGVNSWV